jgi:hypothetical protein
VIALVVSFLIAVYLLVPNAWFRFVLSIKVPLKIFQERKTEDLTRAVVTLSAVFGLALFAVWCLPWLKNHPLNFPDSSELRSSDYRIVASGLYNEAMFKEYGDVFWQALGRTLKRQGRFVCWYYVLVTLVAWSSGWASTCYGKFRRNRFYSRFADMYLLPHISQWYVVLTPFAFKDERTVVKADVLMTDDTLYRGDVADHFLDKDGNLAGLFLANPTRFDRRTYLKEKDAWGVTRSTSVYWRPIPSAKLYLIGEKIVNLNLNYEPPAPIRETLEKYVTKLQKRPISVSIGSVYTSQQDQNVKGTGTLIDPPVPS